MCVCLYACVGSYEDDADVNFSSTYRTRSASLHMIMMTVVQPSAVLLLAELQILPVRPSVRLRPVSAPNTKTKRRMKRTKLV